MFNTNLESAVRKRHVGAQVKGHQDGRRKSMKTSGIHFCYKTRSVHLREHVNIHINTGCKTSIFQIVKNNRMRHTWQPSGGRSDVMWRKTPKFKMLFLEDAGCYRAEKPLIRYILRTPNSQWKIKSQGARDSGFRILMTSRENQELQKILHFAIFVPFSLGSCLS